MERLTQKIVYDNEHCQYVFDYNQDSEVGTKLGELEDILEKYRIENLEEYIKSHQIDNHAQDFTKDLLEENKRVNAVLDLVKQENNDLKQELAELKQKVIISKYKINQECWGVVPKTFWNKKGYVIHFKVKAYIPDNDGIVLMLEDDIASLHYSYGYQVFGTKEEAEQKLAEIKGE